MNFVHINSLLFLKIHQRDGIDRDAWMAENKVYINYIVLNYLLEMYNNMQCRECTFDLLFKMTEHFISFSCVNLPARIFFLEFENFLHTSAPTLAFAHTHTHT